MKPGSETVLKNAGKASLLLRLGSRVCVCLRNDRMDDGLRARIRPVVIGWFACWFDKGAAS
ncbi:MAG: hypothetical protein WBM81_11040 [Sedimenticolaceae bacterium]